MVKLSNGSLLANLLCEEIEKVYVEGVIKHTDESTKTNNIDLVGASSQCDDNGTEVLQ